MDNQEVYLEMKAAEKTLEVKKAAVSERVRQIFERYTDIYNLYNAIKLNVEDFNVFSVHQLFDGSTYLYISNCNNTLLQLELDGEYFFNTDAALEWYEHTLKMEVDSKTVTSAQQEK